MVEATLPRRAGLRAGLLTAAALLAGVPPALAAGGALGASAAASASASAAATVPFQPPVAVPTAADPALEARMLAITGELRCLVCQNQTIADSHADLAVDLRQQVREQIKGGMSDEQIRRYMTDRYGDFVLYRPPLKPTTLVLWLGPGLLLVLALILLTVVIARRAKLADDRFEPDPVLDDDADDAPRAPGADLSARPGDSA